MPIRPENKNRYPKNWKEIRAQILERAGNKCEFCGVGNYKIGYRIDNEFYGVAEGDSASKHCKAIEAGAITIKIILTIAHLDHTPENNDPENLRALCQKCHNSYDAKMRTSGKLNRKRNKNSVKELF